MLTCDTGFESLVSKAKTDLKVKREDSGYESVLMRVL